MLVPEQSRCQVNRWFWFWKRYSLDRNSDDDGILFLSSCLDLDFGEKVCIYSVQKYFVQRRNTYCRATTRHRYMTWQVHHRTPYSFFHY